MEMPSTILKPAATPIAFTWYVLIGAVTTCAVAFISRTARPRAT